jgi:hypothetical protein
MHTMISICGELRRLARRVECTASLYCVRDMMLCVNPNQGSLEKPTSGNSHPVPIELQLSNPISPKASLFITFPCATSI